MHLIDFIAGTFGVTVVALELGRNNLSGCLPASMMEMPNLCKVDLQFNTLSGDIPSQLLQGWSDLEELNLRRNRLDGHLGQVVMHQ